MIVKQWIKLITKRFILILTIFLAVACTDKQAVLGEQSGTDVIYIEVFKQASCSCCGNWVDHLRGAGFDVKTRNRLNLNAIKNEFSIARPYQSCHTAVAEDYIFEGHIPAALIKKFLKEKPIDALGLAVPGMPIGSPGMEMGERFDSYDVLLLKTDGSSEIYAHIDAPEHTSQSSEK